MAMIGKMAGFRGSVIECAGLVKLLTGLACMPLLPLIAEAKPIAAVVVATVEWTNT